MNLKRELKDLGSPSVQAWLPIGMNLKRELKARKFVIE